MEDAYTPFVFILYTYTGYEGMNSFFLFWQWVQRHIFRDVARPGAYFMRTVTGRPLCYHNVMRSDNGCLQRHDSHYKLPFGLTRQKRCQHENHSRRYRVKLQYRATCRRLMSERPVTWISLTIGYLAEQNARNNIQKYFCIVHTCSIFTAMDLGKIVQNVIKASNLERSPQRYVNLNWKGNHLVAVNRVIFKQKLSFTQCVYITVY